MLCKVTHCAGCVLDNTKPHVQALVGEALYPHCPCMHTSTHCSLTLHWTQIQKRPPRQGASFEGEGASCYRQGGSFEAERGSSERERGRNSTVTAAGRYISCKVLHIVVHLSQIQS